MIYSNLNNRSWQLLKHSWFLCQGKYSTCLLLWMFPPQCNAFSCEHLYMLEDKKVNINRGPSTSSLGWTGPSLLRDKVITYKPHGGSRGGVSACEPVLVSCGLIFIHLLYSSHTLDTQLFPTPPTPTNDKGKSWTVQKLCHSLDRCICDFSIYFLSHNPLRLELIMNQYYLTRHCPLD